MLTLRLCKTYAEAISLAGKTAAEFGNDPKKRLFAFCEDKLTMSLESQIARAMGGGTFTVQVTSFNRFIHRYGRVEGVTLDKESSAMAVKSILLSHTDELSCFKRSAYNPGTAVTLYELIAQLKSAKVAPEDLLSGAGSLGGALKGKIDDIAKVYTLYEDYIEKEGLYDSNSYLALMPELIRSGRFKGCSAMLVGYSSMTRQAVDALRALNECMENVWVFTLSGENGELYTNEMKELLMRDIGGFLTVESDYKYDKEREKLMSTLFEPTAFSPKNNKVDTDKIFIYEAEDIEDEISHIAKIIRREVVGGRRYKDMAVAVGSPASYSQTVARIFGDYGIPYFLDDPKPLSSHPLAKLAVQWLDVIKSKGSIESVIALHRNPYYTADKDVCDRFENFIKRNALTPSIMKSGLKRALIDQNVYGEDVELFERERARLACDIKECSTCGDYAEAIFALLDSLCAEEKCKAFASSLEKAGDRALSAFTKQAYQKVCEVLLSVQRVLGGARVSAGDFKNILLSGLAACKVSLLPQLSDAVYVGDYKECKYLEHEILFAAGLGGEVPFTKSDTAVLSDRDLNKLEKFGCIVEPKIKIVNRRERENVGAALLSFTDKLYLSRPNFSADGKQLPKGKVIDYFTASFTKNGRALETVSRVDMLRSALLSGNVKRELSVLEFSSPRPAMRRFVLGSGAFRSGASRDFSAEGSYISALKDFSPDEAERVERIISEGALGLAVRLKEGGELSLRRDELSASVLEQYFSCPFACFMQSGLRLKEREDGSMQRSEFGNLLHAVLEDFVCLLLPEGKNGEKYEIKATSIPKIIAEIMKKHESEFTYGRYLERASYKQMFALTEREAVRAATYILNTLNASDFRPVEVEAAFGPNRRYKPIVISTPQGKKKIVGKVDRVDKFGSYVRIIDYKTGGIFADDESFYTGNHLQLYLYMNALIKEGESPAGAYYFPVHDEMSSEPERAYAMKGKTLLDEEVVNATDPNADENTVSTVLGAKFSHKKGALSATEKAGLTDEQFSGYLKYAIKLAQKGAEEIAEGIIAPSPYSDKCSRCRYASICGFDPDVDGVRKEDGVNSDTITGAVEVDDGN